MADVCTGLYAALSILALLYAQGPSWRRCGTAVAVSLFDTVTELMGYQLTYTRHSGIDQQPLGMGSPAVAPYGSYPTADGQTVVLGTTNDREWQRFARDILARTDLADDERFATNPAGSRTASCSTRRSPHGARNTTWRMCRKSRMPPGSAMPATTRPARC